MSYLQTVQQIKRNKTKTKKQMRRQKQLQQQQSQQTDEEQNVADTSSNRRRCKIKSVQINARLSNGLKVWEGGSDSESDTDDVGDDSGDTHPFSVNRQFAALALMG